VSRFGPRVPRKSRGGETPARNNPNVVEFVAKTELLGSEIEVFGLEDVKRKVHRRSEIRLYNPVPVDGSIEALLIRV
jgi:hypothetical protein